MINYDQAHELSEMLSEKIHELLNEELEDSVDVNPETADAVREKLMEEFRFWRRI